MSTSRQRRVRAHREQLRAQHTRRRPDGVAHQLEGEDQFGAAPDKVLAWSAIALIVLIAVVVAVA